MGHQSTQSICSCSGAPLCHILEPIVTPPVKKLCPPWFQQLIPRVMERTKLTKPINEEFHNVTILLLMFIFFKSFWPELGYRNINDNNKHTEVCPSPVCLHHVPESVCAQTHKSQWCRQCVCQISNNPPPPTRCWLHPVRPPLPCFCLVPKWERERFKERVKEKFKQKQNFVCFFALLRFIAILICS